MIMEKPGRRECRMEISFIIPVFNEEKILADQLASIRKYSPAGLSRELIVVDNHSTDESVRVARDNGVDLVLQSPGNVAALRNEGARHAKGRYLVFLDADVFLTWEWLENIDRALSELKESPRTVTGSWVSIPTPGLWIERTWFARLQETGHSHINTGHLIIAREQFEDLGGFDEHFATGEDYEFSVRAVQNGFALFDDRRLKVIHHGYPGTLRQFFIREVWHGEGDYHDLTAFANSPIAVASQISLVSFAVGAGLAIYLGYAAWAALGLMPLSVVAVGAAMTRWRPSRPRDLPAIILLSYVYFLARGLSLFKAFWHDLTNRQSGRARR